MLKATVKNLILLLIMITVDWQYNWAEKRSQICCGSILILYGCCFFTVSVEKGSDIMVREQDSFVEVHNFEESSYTNYKI